MLHTLWTCSLFCVWGWIVQEELLPWHCWTTRWGPRGWGCAGAHPGGTGTAQGSCQLRPEQLGMGLRSQERLWGHCQSHSHTDLCTCSLLTHTGCYPSRFLCLGQWWSHARDRCELTSQGPGRKVGIGTFLSCGLLLGAVLLLLCWYSWVFHWSQHDSNLRNHPSFYLE